MQEDAKDKERVGQEVMLDLLQRRDQPVLYLLDLPEVKAAAVRTATHYQYPTLLLGPLPRWISRRQRSKRGGPTGSSWASARG